MSDVAVGACLAFLVGRREGLEDEVVGHYWYEISIGVPPVHALWCARYEWDCA